MNKYKVAYENSFKKNLKKLDKNIQQQVLDIADKLQQNTEKGEVLTHNWKGFFSYHFHRKPECRIIYITYDCNENGVCRLGEEHQDDITECLGLMEFVLVATREEMNKLYQTNKKVINNYKRD